jgi:NADPH:quinone reductase-like Zn-dependent oxidoreductase
MKAILISGPGGPEVLTMGETEMPQPEPGEVLVRVLAAGVGPWDGYLRGGSWTGKYPYIPGGEFAGVVVGDTGAFAAFEDGEPVYGYPGLSGCYAEYVTCPAEQLAPIPEGLDQVDAAAVPVNGMTALQGMTDVLDVGAGDTVLITAAAGGLGHLAVQIARALGANVIGTASARHHEFVHTLGAEEVVDHTQPDWPDQVKALVSGGVTKALACAGPTLQGAAKAARDGAVIATPVPVDAFPDSDRVRWTHYNGKPSGTSLIRMAPWFDKGSLEVHVTKRFFWSDAASAQGLVDEGHVRGKVLLVVDEDVAAKSGV